MDRAKIEDALLAMGVSAGIKGFTYIADAVEYIEEHGTDISITKWLYPDIAKKNKTTASRIERAIRHALEVTRNFRGDYELVNHYIGFVNCENSSSLKMLHNRLKQECEEEKSILKKPKEIAAEENFYEELRKIIQEELAQFFGRLNGVEI